MKKYYGELLEEAKNITVIDTHEHIEREHDRIRENKDFLATFLSHYLSTDILNSGMSENELAFLLRNDVDIEAKWNVFKPFWERCSNTAYSKVIKIALKDIYGEDGLNDDTFRRIDAKFKQNHKKGFYKTILKEMCNIEKCILTSPDGDINDYDSDLFTPSVFMDDFIFLYTAEHVKNIKTQFIKKEDEVMDKIFGRNIHSLKDWGQMTGEFICELKRRNHAAIKIAVAYARGLEFENTTRYEAEKAFNSILGNVTSVYKDRHGHYCGFDIKPFSDFMVHSIIKTAADVGFPVQIHTGIQEGTKGAIISSRPSMLINLFRLYPEVKFDIFHAGYPYSSDISAIAKVYPNVYADMAWTYAISPYFSFRCLNEWLETIPACKILGFGGDYKFVEGVYGHLVMARECIAAVLAAKVEDGYFSVSEAKRLMKMILRDNAKQLFKI